MTTQEARVEHLGEARTAIIKAMEEIRGDIEDDGLIEWVIKSERDLSRRIKAGEGSAEFLELGSILRQLEDMLQTSEEWRITT